MTKGLYADFGKRIRVQRQLKRWSGAEAARQMKVARTSLSRWEHGHEMPCGNNIKKLYEYLGVTMRTDELSQGVDRSEVGYQLVLPFDQPANFELRVSRKSEGSVKLEFVLKDRAS